MSLSADLTKRVQLLEPGDVVDLWVFDGTEIGAGTTRFHGHQQEESIWFQGFEYLPWPIEAEGFARTSSATPQPTLTLSNLGGAITALCMQYEDMVGASLTRKRTLVRYLDAENFPPILGTEMVTNGTFADLTGWTQQSGTVTAVSGRMRCTRAGGALGRGRFPLTCVVGVAYRLTAKRYMPGGTLGAAATISISATTATGNIGQVVGDVDGNVTLDFVATQTTHWVFLDSGTGVNGQYAEWDDVHLAQVIQANGNPTANPAEEFEPEIWLVERKSYEDRDKVQFELASAMDLEGQQLPGRVILSARCLWLAIGGYRGPYCTYTGGAVAKQDDTPTSVLAEDKCGGRVESCKKRFGENAQLPFGSFPAAGLAR